MTRTMRLLGLVVVATTAGSSPSQAGFLAPTVMQTQATFSLEGTEVFSGPRIGGHFAGPGTVDFSFATNSSFVASPAVIAITQPEAMVAVQGIDNNLIGSSIEVLHTAVIRAPILPDYTAPPATLDTQTLAFDLIGNVAPGDGVSVSIHASSYFYRPYPFPPFGFVAFPLYEPFNLYTYGFGPGPISVHEPGFGILHSGPGYFNGEVEINYSILINVYRASVMEGSTGEETKVRLVFAPSGVGGSTLAPVPEPSGGVLILSALVTVAIFRYRPCSRGRATGQSSR